MSEPRVVASAPTPQLPPIAALDALDERGFASAVSPLFEGAPRFVARLAAGRPYDSWAALLEHAGETVATLREDELVELIDGHPRIGAAPATVSRLSFAEQGYDREAVAATAPTTAESQPIQRELDRLNAAYEARFGFRFVVFVAGRSRAEIIPLMEERLGADRDTELGRAARDVLAIARDRVRKLRPHEEL